MFVARFFAGMGASAVFMTTIAGIPRSLRRRPDGANAFTHLHHLFIDPGLCTIFRNGDPARCFLADGIPYTSAVFSDHFRLVVPVRRIAAEGKTIGTGPKKPFGHLSKRC